MPTITERFKSGWNAFIGRDPTYWKDLGPGSSSRPDRNRMLYTSIRSIVNSIYNRIAEDCAAIEIREVIVDENRRFKEEYKSELNSCLRLSANIDQTGRALKRDIVMSMFDEGNIAVVPTDTSTSPYKTDSYEIESLRVGKIIEWYPQSVKINLYNEKSGRKEDIILPKSFVAIIENPFYSIMNEPNSILQRLIKTLSTLDLANDEQTSSKLNLLFQLPYSVRSEMRKQQANDRRKELEDQLVNSKYGIGYIDATEHVTQLNRPLENNIWEQVQKLTEQLYNQLGLTAAIFDGTADESAMLNYNNKTLEPVVSAITNEFERKFLTQNARTRGHAILYFSDPFKLVPVNNLAEIADKFTRNEIMSSNEFRAVIGYKPVNDARADELRNKNLNASDEQLANPVTTDEGTDGVAQIEELRNQEIGG